MRRLVGGVYSINIDRVKPLGREVRGCSINRVHVGRTGGLCLLRQVLVAKLFTTSVTAESNDSTQNKCGNDCDDDPKDSAIFFIFRRLGSRDIIRAEILTCLFFKFTLSPVVSSHLCETNSEIFISGVNVS